MDFKLEKAPTDSEISAIESSMNTIIAQDLPVTFEYSTQKEMQATMNLDRLPENASEKIRIVKIGDYDACPCIGKHVSKTSEIGTFKIISTSYNDGILRIRWKTISE